MSAGTTMVAEDSAQQGQYRKSVCNPLKQGGYRFDSVAT
jgi:hypothetical protein